MRANFGFGNLRQGTTFTLPQASSEIFAGGAGKSGQASQQNQYRGSESERQPRPLLALLEITADAVREMRLKIGDTVALLVKSTEVMLVRP